MRKTAVGLLCFCLAWSSVVPAYAGSTVEPTQLGESSILAKYPNVRVIHVSPEEYPGLASSLSRKGYQASREQILVAAQYEAFEAERTEAPASIGSPSPDRCNEQLHYSRRDGNDSDVSLRVTTNTISDFNDATAAVIFVVVGTIVVVVWSLYAFKYLYDLAAGIEPCGRWSEIALSSSVISSDRDREARFNGVRVVSGFREGSTDIGLSAEVGRSEIRLTEVSSLKLEGTYWLLGPILRWRFNEALNPSYFQMEFVAGSTENREMGILAAAKAGFNFGADNGFRWGLNFGALNINLHDNQGIITDRSQYYHLLGLEVGYRF